jgi:hypothetical protein
MNVDHKIPGDILFYVNNTEADHSLLSRTEVNEWRYTSTHPINLHNIVMYATAKDALVVIIVLVGFIVSIYQL